jgi:hypothetical protein
VSSWLRDYPDLLLDDRHAVVTRRDLERMDRYNSLGQPTNPSPGRVWAIPDRRERVRVAVCFVLADPDDPGSVFRHSRPALIVEA